MIKTAIITVSSTRTSKDDRSGQVLKEMLDANKYEIHSNFIIKDDIEEIKKKLIYCADELSLDLVLTTGGTGLGPYDFTPEATLKISSRLVPGLSELIRYEGIKYTQCAVLSRGVSVLRGNTLIINLPGSPKGAQESLETVLALLPHSIDMIYGGGHQ